MRLCFRSYPISVLAILPPMVGCGRGVETVAKVRYRSLLDAKIRCASRFAVPIEDLTLQVSNERAVALCCC